LTSEKKRENNKNKTHHEAAKKLKKEKGEIRNERWLNVNRLIRRVCGRR
jgi:hypothetical protein